MTTTNHFEVYRCDPEYTTVVPKEYANADWETDITVEIAAKGGGSVGESYASNEWIYAVRENGEVVISGSNIRSNASPATHKEMVRVLASLLSAEGQRLYSDSLGQSVEDIDVLKGEYGEAAQEFLASNYERFASLSHEKEAG